MTYAEQHLQETIQIVQQLDAARIEQLALELADLRQRGGRLFFLGVGGSAANASHAVNDFRKIAGIEAYAPTDNVSELTARTNDEGWPTVFRAWLSVSHLSKNDAVFVLSVGGGNLAKNISPNIVSALELAKAEGARIFRDRGTRRRLHRGGRRHRGDHPHGQPGQRHATFRGVPGGRLAPAGLAPGVEGAADQVGVCDEVSGHEVSGQAVYLDRDGVLNRAVVRDGKPYPPSSPDALEIIPGVPEALARLRAAGYRLVVVTNQPDVGRGTMARETVDAIHDRMARDLPLDAIYACLHAGTEGCDCRKPRPGMLLQDGAANGIDMSRSFMVGDRWRDIDAGGRSGMPDDPDRRRL